MGLLNLIFIAFFISTFNLSVIAVIDDDRCDAQLKFFNEALYKREKWSIESE